MRHADGIGKRTLDTELLIQSWTPELIQNEGSETVYLITQTVDNRATNRLKVESTDIEH